MSAKHNLALSQEILAQKPGSRVSLHDDGLAGSVEVTIALP
jgi:hypothetical protein